MLTHPLAIAYSVIVGTINFMISWVAFLFFSDKKKFPVYVLTGYVGIILAFLTDLMMFVFPLWEYPWNEIG